MKIYQAIALSFLFNFSFAQDLSFIKNESLKEKILNLNTFIYSSPTINDNYFDENIYIVSDGYNSFSFALTTKIDKKRIEPNNIKCYKLSEKVVWVISEIGKIEDKVIDKEMLNKLSNCDNLIPSNNKQKSIPEMINSSFSYEFNNYGDYVLNKLNTFDKLLFLSIEFD